MKYRLILHHALTPHIGKGPVSRMVAVYAGNSSYAELSEILDRAVECEFATGGHIEEDVPGIGWCMAHDNTDETEPCSALDTGCTCEDCTAQINEALGFA